MFSHFTSAVIERDVCLRKREPGRLLCKKKRRRRRRCWKRRKEKEVDLHHAFFPFQWSTPSVHILFVNLRWWDERRRSLFLLFFEWFMGKEISHQRLFPLLISFPYAFCYQLHHRLSPRHVFGWGLYFFAPAKRFQGPSSFLSFFRDEPLMDQEESHIFVFVLTFLMIRSSSFFCVFLPESCFFLFPYREKFSLEVSFTTFSFSSVGFFLLVLLFFVFMTTVSSWLHLMEVYLFLLFYESNVRSLSLVCSSLPGKVSLVKENTLLSEWCWWREVMLTDCFSWLYIASYKRRDESSFSLNIIEYFYLLFLLLLLLLSCCIFMIRKRFFLLLKHTKGHLFPPPPGLPPSTSSTHFSLSLFLPRAWQRRGQRIEESFAYPILSLSETDVREVK